MRKLLSSLITVCFLNLSYAQTTVVVDVTNDLGSALPGVNVYAFDGSTYSGSSASTDGSGQATFNLVDGDYRFRADFGGTQYFSSDVNHCTTPTCTAVNVQIPRAVEVTVTGSAGGAESGLNVYAFDGTTYAGKSGVTNVSGVATLQLLDGDYRFRIDKNGTQFFTGQSNHCSVAGCLAASYEIPESIAVTVTSSGNPDVGLNVYAFDGTTYAGKSAVTDANGEAVFTLLPGNYRFRIDKSGTQYFSDAANHCSAPGCSAVSFDIPESVTVSVTSGGSPDVGLNVYAFDGTTYAGKSAVTDVNGEAVFTLLPGNYRFRIDKSGTQYFTDTANHCSAPGCSAVSFDIPEQVAVNVTSSAGGPETGLTVYAFNGTTYSEKSAVTDSTGLANFTLLAGDYRFRIDKNGTQFFTDTVNHCSVPGCTSVAYEVPENVVVTVSSSGGGFESGLSVYAFDEATYVNKSAITDTNGLASFTLVPGNYRFRVDKNGTQYFSDATNHCATPGCTGVAVEVPESITVNVSNNAGGLEPGLTVYAFDEAIYAGKSAVTDANGDAQFTLLAGNYRFRTDKGGSQYFSSPTNHCAVPGCTLISQLLPASLSSQVVDPNLGACLDAAATANGWATPLEVTSLSCANAGVSNLSGLQSFSNLTTLDLSGNPITLIDALNGLNNLTSLDLSDTTLLECSALGTLATSLGAGVLIQPATCLGEGELVYSVANPDKPVSNQFSFAVDTNSSGDIVSSAITFNPGTNSFDGRVFLIDGTNGDELLELQNPSPSGSDYFGWSVAALNSGDIAVGAWQDDVGGVAAGAVHVFSGSDGAYLRTIQNPNPSLDDRFGYSIAATASDNIAIGAYLEAGGGAVYVYDALGVLQNTVANPSGDSNAEFGKSVVANSNGDIVIGAPKEDVTAAGLMADAGVVHIYSEVSGTPILVIDNPQAAVNDDFGSSVAVAVNGDLIISARFVDNFANNDGSVFVHNGIDGSLIWSTSNPVADAEGLFGVSVAGTPQGHVVVGAANDDTGASNSGKVFVFDGVSGNLIKVIPNPTPDANVNFGQGLGITPSGQIAVGAFGADGGFGTLHLFTSIGVGEDLDLVNEQPFPDANLQGCILGEAANNGWATVDEVTALDCSDSLISDLTGLDALTELTSLDLTNNDAVDIAGLENLTNLTNLDLTSNEGILCADLDALELALGTGVVVRPAICSNVGLPLVAQVQSLHNAQGQRVVKTVSGDPSSTIHFIYDRAGRVIAEIDATTGATTREYIYAIGIQVALLDDTDTQDEATYFVHTDHLGTPQKITDDSQSVVWGASYEPFGEVTKTVAEIENNIRFSGQYADGETNLYHNYFRDYDPDLGRYIESDPIGLFGGLNTFSYALNNPIKFIDPLGLDSYLVSRPLGFPGAGAVASHNFVVTNADFLGDPSANVISFGNNGTGSMARVDSNTTGTSSSTSATDTNAWQSLGAGTTGGRVRFRQIDADDAVVNSIANSVNEGTPYGLWPDGSGNTLNSNSAAGAVANSADGGSFSVRGGRLQPGAGAGMFVEFDTIVDAFVCRER